MTADRFATKPLAEPVRVGLIQAVTAQHPKADVDVAFGNRAEVAGLQVADVIANSAFQALVQHAASKAVMRLLAPLMARGVLQFQHVRLDGVRPA